jgi:hypothetical protein
VRRRASRRVACIHVAREKERRRRRRRAAQRRHQARQLVRVQCGDDRRGQRLTARTQQLAAQRLFVQLDARRQQRQLLPGRRRVRALLREHGASAMHARECARLARLELLELLEIQPSPRQV